MLQCQIQFNEKRLVYNYLTALQAKNQRLYGVIKRNTCSEIDTISNECKCWWWLLQKGEIDKLTNRDWCQIQQIRPWPKRVVLFLTLKSSKIIFDTWIECEKTGLTTALAHRDEFKWAHSESWQATFPHESISWEEMTTEWFVIRPTNWLIVQTWVKGKKQQG